jgi:PAS domain S-box-containing protein
MSNTDPGTPFPSRTSASELSATVRRRSRELAELLSRLTRLTRAADEADSPLLRAADDMGALASSILQDLAGAEMETHRRVQQMRSERQRADCILEHVPVPCVTADEEGRIIQANRAAALLLNVSARHLVDQRLFHFSQDREAFFLLLARLRRDGGGAECEIVLRPRERQTVVVMASVLPVEGSVGEWLWSFAAQAVVSPPVARRGGRGRTGASTWTAPASPPNAAQS